MNAFTGYVSFPLFFVFQPDGGSRSFLHSPAPCKD
jgi:hypothetical protein